MERKAYKSKCFERIPLKIDSSCKFSGTVNVNRFFTFDVCPKLIKYRKNIKTIKEKVKKKSKQKKTKPKDNPILISKKNKTKIFRSIFTIQRLKKENCITKAIT